MENLLYLFLSVTLSAGRNIASKKTAVYTNKKAQFFLSQTIIFASAALLLLLFYVNNRTEMAWITFVHGLAYGVLLISSQWMFTLALKNGNTSVCSVVYSLGFILPTVSGTLFWGEDFGFLQLIGVFVSVAIILLTAKKDGSEKKRGNRFSTPCILIAMISSGGLGIMQKVQQSSAAAKEKGIFLLAAFSFAFFCSLAAFLFFRERTAFTVHEFVYPVFTGLCFGGANLCNTVLAGKMQSAVFFPLQNMSTILLTALSGVFIYKEKLTLKTAVIIVLGMAVIIMFSL